MLLDLFGEYFLYIAFGLRASENLHMLFGTWVRQVDQNLRPLVCVGVNDVLWYIWLCRNEVIFNNKR